MHFGLLLEDMVLGCCTGDGYAYIEYMYDKEISLVDEEDWIKINGVIEIGNEDGTDYPYIKVITLEKMSERGLDTVST